MPIADIDQGEAVILDRSAQRGGKGCGSEKWGDMAELAYQEWKSRATIPDMPKAEVSTDRGGKANDFPVQRLELLDG